MLPPFLMQKRSCQDPFPDLYCSVLLLKSFRLTSHCAYAGSDRRFLNKPVPDRYLPRYFFCAEIVYVISSVARVL